MRISDWSSDVCSSDLSGGAVDAAPGDARYLVDLPGYGYAKVTKDLQAHWQAFLDGYFGSRMALRGLVVVMDIRHPLKDYDRQMRGYAVQRGLPAHVLLTKAAKLLRGRSEEHTSELKSLMRIQYAVFCLKKK